MKKSLAIELLGGSASAAAAAVGVTPSAISQWPEDLPPRLVDRVHAAQARKHLPAELLGMDPQPAAVAAIPTTQAAPAAEQQENRHAA